MDAGGLDLNTLVTIGLFVAGYIVAKWDRDRSAHTKSIQVDTELRERVQALAEKVSEQSGVTRSVTRLETLMTTQTSTLQGFQRDLHELRMWMMGAHSSPLTLRHKARSPYDFPGAREFLEPDAEA